MESKTAELSLRLRIAAQSTALWVLARMGDPLAVLLDTPGREDPYSVYEQVRARGPLHRSRTGVWASADFAVCSEVLRDRRFGVRTSAGDFGDPIMEAVNLELSILELDPPDHTRLRRLAAPAFRPRRLEAYRHRIEQAADALLEEAAGREEFDLIKDFATPLPVRVICELMNMPDVGLETLTHHGAVLAGTLDGIRSGKQLRGMRESAAELDVIFTELAQRRREQPGDDIVSDLVTALDEDRLSSFEMVKLCQLLLIAGFETTVNLIGNGTLALLRHPEQWALLRENPDLAGAVVDETLRWDPPVHATQRIVQEPLRLAGRDLPIDTPVVTLLAAAGRDPAVHSDPDRFDITREDRGEHLAFSGGIHYCLGAPLAKMEAEIAFRTLAKKLPELRLAGTHARRRTTLIHGLTSLPVTGGAARSIV